MTGVFRTSDERVTVVEEKEMYTNEELVADIGGALGFFLGLSILKLISMIVVACMKMHQSGQRIFAKQKQQNSSLHRVSKKVCFTYSLSLTQADNSDFRRKKEYQKSQLQGYKTFSSPRKLQEETTVFLRSRVHRKRVRQCCSCRFSVD